MTNPSVSVECDQVRARVAHHEAGHAMTDIDDHRRFTSVSIVADDISCGRVANQPYTQAFADALVSDLDRPNVRVRIEGLLADGTAERHAFGSDAGTMQDWQVAALVHHIAASTAETAAYLAWLNQRAINLWLVNWHWRGVEALAAALLAHDQLSYRRSQTILTSVVDAWLARAQR